MTTTTYYENGQKEYEIIYSNDKYNGTFRTWHKNGVKKEKGTERREGEGREEEGERAKRKGKRILKLKICVYRTVPLTFIFNYSVGSIQTLRTKIYYYFPHKINKIIQKE